MKHVTNIVKQFTKDDVRQMIREQLIDEGIDQDFIVQVVYPGPFTGQPDPGGNYYHQGCPTINIMLIGRSH